MGSRRETELSKQRGRSRRVAALGALLAAIALLVVACGGGDEASPTAAEEATTAETTTTSAAATAESSEAQPAPIPITEPGARETVTLQIAGNEVDVTIVLPNDYAPGEPHPILFALPPGGQAQAQVEFGLDRFWADEAQARGWIVVSPAAPEGALFFQGSEAIVPELLDTIAATYPPESDVFHVAGISNGGLSAFRIATESPERFASIVVLPGFPPTEDDLAMIDSLVGIPVHMYAGETDTIWVEGSERALAALEEVGGQATLSIEPNGGHIPAMLTGAELFEVLEDARPG